MQIDLTPLLSGAEKRISFELAEFLEDTVWDSDISFPQPIRVNGAVTNQAGYLHLTLQAHIVYETSCARCLAPIRKECTLQTEKGVALAASLENEENDDYLTYTDRTLVLDEAVGDLFFLHLPWRHLCKEDCAGFCDQCGKNLNEGKCACSTKTPDPRLAVLGQLLRDMDSK